MINYLIMVFLFLFVSASFAQNLKAIDIDEIPSEKILTNEEKIAVKESLKTKIIPTLTPIKNDYVDKDNRGTVEFRPRKQVIDSEGKPHSFYGNYSRHKTIIPDGTTVEGVNFMQANPHTEAIEGKNLTFINCNLTNVEIEPSWIIIHSNTTQAQTRIEEIDGKTYKISEVEKNGQMVEIARDDITPINSDK